VQPDIIPQLAKPSVADEEYGAYLRNKLEDDFEPATDHPKRETLLAIFDELIKAAGADHLDWHVHLLKAPQIVDMRTVHGNYLFVWSGLLDVVANDAELAGLLACELAHTLAHHTDPAQLTVASELLFNAAELAASLGLMFASQGIVTISGFGWMKLAYVELADLDSLDRKYSLPEEREAANIALLVVSRTPYPLYALIEFWQRAAAAPAQEETFKRISRGLSPGERAEMLEELLFHSPEIWGSYP
jgi:predicted Zn-dependent protease